MVKISKHMIIRRGIIKEVYQYDSGDGIYVGDEVLSDSLSDITGKNVSVRIYISDKEKEVGELKSNMILALSGSLYADYGDRYSDYTGYLWTDDKLQIDNHDLLYDISQHLGKFLHLEIDIH